MKQTKKRLTLKLVILSLILPLALISCQTTQIQPQENNTEVIFPEFPESKEDMFYFPDHCDENGKDLVEYNDNYVTMPLSIWNQYFVYEDEVIISYSYLKKLAFFKIDYEAALERLEIYKKEALDNE